MAKNISLLGADYPDVPAVQLPQTGGGTATFYDIQVVDNLNSDSSTDALSAKQGKVLNSKLTNYLPQYRLTSENIDSDPSDYRIGIGVVNNLAYYYLNASWIGLQFRVGSGTFEFRLKYGGNAWTTWKNLSN